MQYYLKEELEEILTEDPASIFVSVPLAMGIILGPWLIRQRKIKQKRKEQCNNLEGLAKKKCIINVESAALKSEKAKLLQSISQCQKHPEPKRSRCKTAIQNLANDYGWSFGGEIAGHIIGQYPHEKLEKENKSNYIHPQNHSNMNDLNAKGERKNWILEIHFVDKKKKIGGFFEQLMA